MKVEVKNLYVKKWDKEKNSIFASAHISMPEFGLEIRGIGCCKIKNKWHIQLPFQWGYGKNQKKIQYSIISFSETAFHKAFQTSIISSLKEFLAQEEVRLEKYFDPSFEIVKINKNQKNKPPLKKIAHQPYNKRVHQ